MATRATPSRRIRPATAGALCLALAAVLLATRPAHAHGISHRTDHAGAVAVTFTYADGTPIAFADFQVHGPADPRPAAAGLTDRAGRAVFLPHRPGQWTVRVTTADGHGKTVQLDLTGDDLAALDAGSAAATAATGPDAATGSAATAAATGSAATAGSAAITEGPPGGPPGGTLAQDAGGPDRWLRAALGVGLILLIALVLSTVLRRAGARDRAGVRDRAGPGQPPSSPPATD